MSVVCVGSLCFGMWRSQRERIGALTPAQKALYGLVALQIGFAVLSFNRAVLPFNVDGITVPYLCVLVPLTIASLLWYQRERRFNPPWRGLKSFDANPVATEERFRLSSLSGLIMGATMGDSVHALYGLAVFRDGNRAADAHSTVGILCADVSRDALKITDIYRAKTVTSALRRALFARCPPSVRINSQPPCPTLFAGASLSKLVAQCQAQPT